MYSNKQLRDYISDGSRFVAYFGQINCSIAHTCQRAAERHGLEAPRYIAACGYDALPTLKRERREMNVAISVQETFPFELAFPLFHIYDGKRLYITDVNIFDSDPTAA